MTSTSDAEPIGAWRSECPCSITDDPGSIAQPVLGCAGTLLDRRKAIESTVRPRCGMFLGRVSETLDITGRGVVVAFGTTYEQLPQDFKLKIGDPVEFRSDGVVVLQSSVAGIEHCS